VIKKYGLNIRSNSKNLCRVTQKSKKRVCAGAVTRPEGSGARGEDDSAAPEQQLPVVVVVVECDGILVDIHNTGHRKAFNLAFEVLYIVAVRSLLMNVVYNNAKFIIVCRKWDTVAVNGQGLCTLICYALVTLQVLVWSKRTLIWWGGQLC